MNRLLLIAAAALMCVPSEAAQIYGGAAVRPEIVINLGTAAPKDSPGARSWTARGKNG